MRTWTLDRWIVMAAALVATSAALYASYDALCGLAAYAAWRPRVRPMLPLTVDVIAVASGVLLARTKDAALRALAWRGVTWSGAGSVVGNAVYHLLAEPDVPWWRRALSVAVAAVPAVGIAYVVHVLSMLSRTDDAAELAHDEHQDHAEPAPVPAAPPARPSVPAVRQPVDVPEDVRPRGDVRPPSPMFPGVRPGTSMAVGLAALAENPELSTDELAERADCGKRQAQNIVKRWEADFAATYGRATA
jgi:hypothetical protein